MKIAYVYYTDHNQRSAHNNQIIHTCSGLLHAGHEVTVVTAGGLKEYASEHDLAVSFDVRKATSIFGWGPVRQIRYYIGALLTGQTHEVIYTRDISFLKFLTLVPDAVVPPVVFEAHKCHAVVDGMDPDEERRRLNEANGIITLSDGIRSDLEDLGVTVDAVIWDAANTDYVPSASKSSLRSELGIDQNTTVFVYAGSFNSDKYDIESVIEAFGSISGDEDRSLYVLGGEPSQVEALEHTVRTAGIDDTVCFLGYIPQRKVFEYLKAADIGLVAQQPTDVRASKYTSPLKLFEYLVSGLCVVATDVPSITEVAQNEPRILTYDPYEIGDLKRVLETASVECNSIETDDIDWRYSYEYRSHEIVSVLNKYVETS